MSNESRCAFTGEDKCALVLSREHREQLNSTMETLDRVDELTRELKMIGESLRELVMQERESRREYMETLRGKTPVGYVPFKTHLLTVLLALGITQLPAIVRILETIIK